MLVDSELVKFQGFHPSSFTREFLQSKMHELHEEAPEQSTLKATFTRKDRELKGVVSISSSAGRFLAVASGHKLNEVSHKLVEQMRRQLAKWKTLRFRRQYT